MTTIRAHRTRTAVLLLAAGLLVGLVAPHPARATTTSERTLASLINRERTSRGIRALRLNEALSDVARRHSRRMLEAGAIFHNSRLPYELRNWSWRYLGEDVGRGTSVYAIHRQWMASDSHRRPILRSVYWQMGVGVVYGNGRAWATVIFYG